MGKISDSMNYNYYDMSTHDDKTNGCVFIDWVTSSEDGTIICKDDIYGLQKIRIQKGHIDAIEAMIKSLKEHGSY